MSFFKNVIGDKKKKNKSNQYSREYYGFLLLFILVILCFEVGHKK